MSDRPLPDLTSQELAGRYRPIERLTHRGVLTHRAVDERGASVLIHFIGAGDDLPGIFDPGELVEKDARMLVAVLRVDGLPVVITREIIGFRSFEEWFAGARFRATVARQSSDSSDFPAGGSRATAGQPELGGEADQAGVYTRILRKSELAAAAEGPATTPSIPAAAPETHPVTPVQPPESGGVYTRLMRKSQLPEGSDSGPAPTMGFGVSSSAGPESPDAGDATAPPTLPPIPETPQRQVGTAPPASSETSDGHVSRELELPSGREDARPSEDAAVPRAAPTRPAAASPMGVYTRLMRKSDLMPLGPTPPPTTAEPERPPEPPSPAETQPLTPPGDESQTAGVYTRLLRRSDFASPAPGPDPMHGRYDAGAPSTSEGKASPGSGQTSSPGLRQYGPAAPQRAPLAERPYRLFDSEPPPATPHAEAGGLAGTVSPDGGYAQPSDDYLRNLRADSVPAPSTPPPKPTAMPSRPQGPSEYTMVIRGGFPSPPPSIAPGQALPPPPAGPAPTPQARAAPPRPGPRKGPIIIGLIVSVALLIGVLATLAILAS